MLKERNLREIRQPQTPHHAAINWHRRQRVRPNGTEPERLDHARRILGQTLEPGHGDEGYEKVLEGVRLAHGIPDILCRDLDVTTCFARIVKKDPVADDVGFAWSEIAPALETDKGITIACLWWDEESKDDASKDCD